MLLMKRLDRFPHLYPTAQMHSHHLSLKVARGGGHLEAVLPRPEGFRSPEIHVLKGL